MCGTGGGCISDGPFKDQIVHLGPFNSTTRNNYCLRRDINPILPAGFFTPAAIAETMSQTYFETFRTFLEGVNKQFAGQHGAGHSGVGGQVGTSSACLIRLAKTKPTADVRLVCRPCRLVFLFLNIIRTGANTL